MRGEFNYLCGSAAHMAGAQTPGPAVGRKEEKQGKAGEKMALGYLHVSFQPIRAPGSVIRTLRVSAGNTGAPSQASVSGTFTDLKMPLILECSRNK